MTTDYNKTDWTQFTYRNHTSRQHQFKTGVPQGGVLSTTLFNICTSDFPPPSSPDQTMAYADITSQARVQTKNTYNYTYIKFLLGQKKYLILNPDKTTPYPAEYTSNLDLKIHNNALPMATHPKVLGLP